MPGRPGPAPRPHADPRRRLGHRRQARAGPAPPEPHGRPGLGRLQRELPPQPGRRLPRSPGRPQAGPGLDQGACRRVRHRPRLRLRHRRLGRRPPHRADGRSPPTTPPSSPASRTPTPAWPPPSPSTASTTSPTPARSASDPEIFRRFLEPLVMKAFLAEEPEKFEAASPIHHLRPDAPPFFVIHGDRDTLAPVADARTFVDQLRAVSSEPVLYAEMAGRPARLRGVPVLPHRQGDRGGGAVPVDALGPPRRADRGGRGGAGRQPSRADDRPPRRGLPLERPTSPPRMWRRSTPPSTRSPPRSRACAATTTAPTWRWARGAGTTGSSPSATTSTAGAAYEQHPAHQQVVTEVLRPRIAERAAVQIGP